MGIVLMILEIIVSVLLMCIILAQSGKENGLSGALSGNSESYMNKGNRMGMDRLLASATKWIALVWVALAVALYLVY